MSRRGSWQRARRAGFTLIELILAIGLTIGLMLIVLYFYQQASRLRGDMLIQTERVTAARLLLERVTRELRSARPDSFLLLGLRGSSNEVEFVSAGLPWPPHWREPAEVEGTAVAGKPFPSDLKIIRYRLAFDGDITNAVGIARAQEGLLELPVAPADGQPTAPPTGQLLTDQLRFLQLRYWDGKAWVDHWDALALPAGVEVTVAPQAPPAEPVLDEEIEVYRRIIYLPGSELVPEVPEVFDPLENSAEVPG